MKGISGWTGVAFGQLTNGDKLLTTQKNYTPEGLWTNVKTFNSSNTILQNMSFDFNRINGLLNSRTDVSRGLTESFTYDGLYRLKAAGLPTLRQTVNYDTNGNILSKSDAGGYTYDISGKPYTLSKLTNPNLDETPQLNVDYTLMSRPKSISNVNGLTTTFIYNDNFDRVYSELKSNNAIIGSIYYFAGGKYELESGIQRLYLDGTPYTASIIIEKTGSASPQNYYIHRDYLGSVMQITDNLGNLADENSYDAWGSMRNPANWYPLSSDRKPLPWFRRGFTGHEHLAPFTDDYGGRLINMNARLYDPILGRFLAPDPFVGSGLTNDFNRYIYCRNNPLMFTDPSGMSFKEWWKSNVTDAFNRAFNSTFGNGQGGWEIGYNSSGGFFTNPTYNGRAIGPSAYYNPSNKQVSFGNGSSGFHDNTSSIRINNNIEQSVVQAEQGARGEYFGQKTFESSYNFMVNLANLAFKESEYEKLYGSEKQQGIPIDFDNAMNVGGTTFGVGAATEELSKLGYKNFKLVAIPFVGFNAYSAWDKASSPNATAINYMDFGMGVLDAGAALELFSRANIYVGGATLVYGLVRIGYDYYQSSSTNYYSPIYQINGKAVRLW